MPSINATKKYLPDSYYHIYNRGVEKREIFVDNEDVAVFEKYVIDAALKQKVKICEYAYKPNHFHLLVFQSDSRAIVRLMRSISARYTVYFNIRHARVGRLFQGTYKARLVNADQDYFTVVNYIKSHFSDTEEVTPGLTLW